jgi:hypothetical protein
MDKDEFFEIWLEIKKLNMEILAEIEKCEQINEEIQLNIKKNSQKKRICTSKSLNEFDCKQ